MQFRMTSPSLSLGRLVVVNIRIINASTVEQNASVVQIGVAHRFLEILLEKIILDLISLFAHRLRKVKTTIWKKNKNKKKRILLSTTHQKTNYTSK